MPDTYGPGVHQVSAEIYHSDPCAQPSLSASIAARLINETPAHARLAHPRLNPTFERVEKTQFDLGNLAHTIFLEGHADRVAVLEFDNFLTKAAKTAREEAREGGLIPVLSKDFERVQHAVEAWRIQVMNREFEPPLFAEGKAEVMIVWEEGGVTCRALVDWLRDDFLAIDDLKSTSGSANPILWAKRALKQIGADVQVAFYRRGVKALTGKEAAFRYTLAETEPPFLISTVSLDPSWLDLGEAKVERAIEKWRACTEDDNWPGWPEPIYYAEAPAWAELEFMELDGEVFAS